MVTDSIGDMLTRIRNGIRAQHEAVDIPSSKVKQEIARILKEEGFISKHEVLTRLGKKALRITLKYGPEGKSVISVLRRISKPGRRIYVKRDSIPRVLSGFGIAVLSTSKGIMAGRQARKAGLGGEVLCYVW